MSAQLLLRERRLLSEESFVEMVVWRVPEPVRGSRHDLKYRLAFIVKGVCVLRYDNETGKGDHKHIEGKEAPYAFSTPAQLLADFWNDIGRWRS